MLSNDEAKFVDLGANYYESRVNLNRRTRNHVRELQALGYKVDRARRLNQAGPPNRPSYRLGRR